MTLKIGWPEKSKFSLVPTPAKLSCQAVQAVAHDWEYSYFILPFMLLLWFIILFLSVLFPPCTHSFLSSSSSLWLLFLSSFYSLFCVENLIVSICSINYSFNFFTSRSFRIRAFQLAINFLSCLLASFTLICTL